jgi:hypothetical protein
MAPDCGEYARVLYVRGDHQGGEAAIAVADLAHLDQMIG